MCKVESTQRLAHEMTGDQLNAMEDIGYNNYGERFNALLRIGFSICDILMRIVTRSTVVHNYRYIVICLTELCEDNKMMK